MKEFCKSIVVRLLTLEARLLLKRAQPKIIAITGNVGKTSTKDAIYEVLKDHVNVRKSEKSFNSEIGVPLSVLGLDNAGLSFFGWIKNLLDGLLALMHPKTYPDVLVLEMGVDRPGDMKALTSWVTPDVVVLTSLPAVPVHVEYFSSPEAVIAEKLQLVEALKPDGTLVFNNDDEKIRSIVSEVRQKAIGYSRYSVSHFQASADKIVYKGAEPVGLEFTLTHFDDTTNIVVQQSLGVPHIFSYTAAAAVGSLFDISIADAARALSDHVPTRGRMRLVRGLKDTIIIDDSYNSSPTAAHRAVLTLQEMQVTGRKIAVLGDMLELGKFSVREHERVGEQVATAADVLITVGVRSRKIAEAALEFGLSEKHIYQYDEIERASGELQTLLQAGDVVLVKASQGIRAEKLVEEIMAEPERAGELLVRQGSFWENR